MTSHYVRLTRLFELMGERIAWLQWLPSPGTGNGFNGFTMGYKKQFDEQAHSRLFVMIIGYGTNSKNRKRKRARCVTKCNDLDFFLKSQSQLKSGLHRSYQCVV